MHRNGRITTAACCSRVADDEVENDSTLDFDFDGLKTDGFIMRQNTRLIRIVIDYGVFGCTLDVRAQLPVLVEVEFGASLGHKIRRKLID